jgi:transcriptional regulator with XRE-family HTH domain
MIFNLFSTSILKVVKRPSKLKKELGMKVAEASLAKAIGRAISKRRIEKSITQAVVAERLNIGNEAVSRMERGTVIPTVARLIELATIFECSVSDLLTETSTRAADQERTMHIKLDNLLDVDRAVLLEVLEKLATHLSGRKSSS